MSSQQRVAFIGLGAMGYPMAGHLQRHGLDVCVYNRTETKSFAWVDEFGGSSAPTPAEAAVGASVVFLCVGNDSDVRAVTSESEGVLSTMTQGALLVDHTTTSKELALEIARCLRRHWGSLFGRPCIRRTSGRGERCPDDNGGRRQCSV
jgi:3-hydroxyisobutyrate dehydrogenase